MLTNPHFKRLLCAAAVGALCGGLAARAQTSTAPATTGQGTTQSQSQATGQGSTGQGSTASGTGATSKAALSRADRQIVMNMALANMAEIENAKLAQTKGQSAEVKSYAQQIIDDHSKALEEVQQLAQAKGVTLPTELDKTHRAKADKLAATPNDKFDSAYLAQSGVAEHKKVHGMLRKAQSSAKDPDVKALAAKILPTVESHLKHAEGMRDKAGKGKSDSPATSSG